MSIDQQNSRENSEETIASSEPVAPEASGAEEVASAPATQTTEPPAAFLRLKEYCDNHNVKNTIQTDVFGEIITLEFRNGRLTRMVEIGSEESADALLQYPLHEIVFLGSYSAICSYKNGWIEAAVRPHGAGPGRGFIARRKIFGVATPRNPEEPAEVEIAGPNGLVLRLSEKRGCLFWLDYGASLYLRIEGIGITEHDKALNLLEDISNSLFMQIDFRFDSPLTLGRGRFPSRRLSKSRGKLDEDTQLGYPRFSYDRNPSSLYWYARSASSMPLLQFLAFYQCIEFFFPQYSRQETIAKIKNMT